MYLCREFGKANNHAVSPLPWKLQTTSGHNVKWKWKAQRLCKLRIALQIHLSCTYDVEYILEVSGRIKSLLFKEKSSFGFLGGVARARFSDRHRLHAFIHNLLLRPPVTSRPHVARSLQTLSATPPKCERTAGDSHRSHSIPTGDP